MFHLIPVAMCMCTWLYLAVALNILQVECAHIVDALWRSSRGNVITWNANLVAFGEDVSAYNERLD